MTTGSAPFKNNSNSRPTPEQIARLAFDLRLNEGWPDGGELVFWFRAERMLLEEIQKRILLQQLQRPDQSPLGRATSSA